MSETANPEVRGELRRFRPYPDYRNSCVEWLGEIPPHWEMRRLKYIASLNDETLSEDADPNLEIRYVDIGSVHTIDGIVETEQLTFNKAPSRARRIVRDGDVIVSTVRTYLRAVAAITDLEPNLIVSTGFAVVRPRSEFWSSFAAYVLKAPYFVDRVVANSVGVSYPAINPSQMACLPIAVPPLHEQRAIAEFLDRETGKIDALVAKKERLIELLQERCTALITRAVIQGLDPNVLMKDSGVEWLGKVPAHWRVLRNRALFQEIDQRSETGDEELLTVSHITGVTRRSEKEVTMIEAESHEDYKLCEQGDLAINTMWAWMGALGIAWETGIVSPSYNVYRIKNDALLPGYFDYLCRTPAYVCDIIRHSKGVWKSRLRLYPDEFRDVVTLVPPPADQNHIAAYLSREIVKSDALTEKIREGIDRLREYRTALISAAVTGKIDVREETAAADQRYLRNIFAAEIVHRWHDRPTFGHVSAHKIFYLAEMHLRVDEFDGAYQRRAAGPYDSDLMSDIDSSLRERRWYEAVQENGKAKRYWYRPLENAGGHRRDFDLFWGHKKTALDRLLADLDEFDSDGLEVIATLYAAWNDLLIDGKMVTDETLITEVRERWHLEKARIQEETWRLLLAWMKRHGLVPSGRGRKTKVGDLL